MNITSMNVAKTTMMWNGIRLNEGDLYGHESWHGDIYCHTPIGDGNFIHFTNVNGGNFSCKLYDLPSNIHYYNIGDDTYFEETLDLTEQTVQRLFDEAMDKRHPNNGGYEVHFTDSYGMKCGCIGKLATYEDAVRFIVAQADELIYMDKWHYRDGFDLYEIMISVEVNDYV